MKRVLIAISAILMATAILLKLSELPENSAARKMFNSSFSFSTSSSGARALDTELLHSFAPDYSFLNEDSLRDHTLVICFWEPDSEASKEALPYLNTLAQKNRNRKVIFIAAAPVSAATASAFLQQHKYDLAMKQIYGQAALRIFNEMLPPASVSGVLPVNIIVNPKSEIIFMQEGFSEEEARVFERYLESQLMR